VLLLLLLCSIWGVQQVTVKIANTGLSPMFQAGLRSCGATVLVFAWARYRGVVLFGRDGTLIPGIVAGLLFAFEFAMIFRGLLHTTAARGVVFVYTAPFFVALGAVWLLPEERLRRSQWLGMTLAFAGVVALFGENLVRPVGPDAWLGDLMMTVAAAAWAATTLVVRATPLSAAAPEKTLLYQLAASAVVLPIASWACGEPGVVRLDTAVCAAFAFQTVIVASASYLGWFWLVSRYPATRLSAFSFMTPVFGVISGTLLLGEPLTPALALALPLVGSGIYVANRTVPRRAVAAR
jgi:drug/metabolite transporter (DMT)-like permease